MATMITGDCINCGACEPECPNNAISQGNPVYVIDPLLCTECVGFHDYEACAAVCPVDVCVTDPNNVESEEVLIARARVLHKDTEFGEGFQSRFRKTEASKPAAPAVEPVPTQEKPAVVAAPKPAATLVAASATAAKPVAPKPVPVKRVPRPQKVFADELPVGFEKAANQYSSGGFLQNRFVRAAVIILQPVIGALPHGIKQRLEAAIQSPWFTAAGSTATNIVHNALLYPLISVALAAGSYGPAVIFTPTVNKYFLVGLIFALVEGVFRLRDGIFHVKPADEMRFPASIYGAPLALVAEPLLAKYTGLVRDLPIPVDGFYSDGFVDKLERERRYGNVYTVEDRGGAYLVKMEFPRCMPDIGVAKRAELPDEMPDYDYDLALRNGELIVKGTCSDEQVRKISSSVGAFPPEFTTTIPFDQRVAGFAHQFKDKMLEVLLVKV